MALIDKMKAQASQLAQKAQEAGKAGQAKLGDVLTQRKFDGLLHDFGAAVYADRKGPSSDETKAEVERLFNALTAMEAENGPLHASDGEAEKHGEGDAAD